MLVGHDASGPDVISHTLRHPERVAHLVLLDSYYCNAPALRFPEMVQLFADERPKPLADAIVADSAQQPFPSSLAAKVSPTPLAQSASGYAS